MKEILYVLACCFVGLVLAPIAQECRDIVARDHESRFLSYLEHRQKFDHRERNARILAALQRLQEVK